MELDNNLPPMNEYYEYLGPDRTLCVGPSQMVNLNKPKDMEKIRYFYHQFLFGLVKIDDSISIFIITMKGNSISILLLRCVIFAAEYNC